MILDLQQLINQPREDLAVEYKNWLDFGKEDSKAILAKGCIALANHGGGFLVLGFDEKNNSLTSTQCPDDHMVITQDLINGIIRRYAEPSFHCKLEEIEHPVSGVNHFIVSVPGNQIVPVISKRTYLDKIKQNSCYIRKPGPCSEEPQKADEWRNLLRRCVLADKVDLLNSIRSIVHGQVPEVPLTSNTTKAFNDFRENSFKRWETLKRNLSLDSPGRFPMGYYETAVYPVNATPTENLNELRKMLEHAQGIKLTGWPPFLEFNREEWKSIPIDDNIEAWIKPTKDKQRNDAAHADYWRASRFGQLYTIRGFFEDSLEEWKNIEPGVYIGINLPIRQIGEILYFATRFLSGFQKIQTVKIQCRFIGLMGRTLANLDDDPVWLPPSHCKTNKVSKTITVDFKELENNMPEIVHQLLSPLYESFDFYQLELTSVASELSKLLNKES